MPKRNNVWSSSMFAGMLVVVIIVSSVIVWKFSGKSVAGRTNESLAVLGSSMTQDFFAIRDTYHGWYERPLGPYHFSLIREPICDGLYSFIWSDRLMIADKFRLDFTDVARKTVTAVTISPCASNIRLPGDFGFSTMQASISIPGHVAFRPTWKITSGIKPIELTPARFITSFVVTPASSGSYAGNLELRYINGNLGVRVSRFKVTLTYQ